MNEHEYINNLENSSKYKNDVLLANSYNIKEFVPEDILVRDGVMSIVAQTGAGKSCLIIDLLSKIHTSFEHIIMFSKTAKLQRCYDFLDRELIYDRFDEEFLTALWNDRVNKQLLGLEQERTLIIFDDILCDPKIRSSHILKDLFCGSRHLAISMWCLSHNYTVLSPIQRQNTCWFVAFDLDSYKEKQNLVGQYLSAQNQKVGEILFKRITKEKKYQCIIIEAHKSGAPVEDKVRKYISNPKPPKFKIKAKVIEYLTIDEKEKVEENQINTKPRRR